MKKIFPYFFIFTLILVAGALAWSPYDDIEMWSYYGIKNATSVNSSIFCDNSGNCGTITEFLTAASLTDNSILSDWNNITGNKPTNYTLTLENIGTLYNATAQSFDTDTDTTYDNSSGITLDSTTFGLDWVLVNATIEDLDDISAASDYSILSDWLNITGNKPTNYTLTLFNIGDLYNATAQSFDTDTDTTYTSDELYINLVGTQFIFNQTINNATISALDTDTTRSNYELLSYLANITDFTEADLNVNNSDYLDSYTSADFILAASEGNLNVNASTYLLGFDKTDYVLTSALNNQTPIGLSGTTYSLMPCGNSEGWIYNTTSAAWACGAIGSGVGTVTSVASGFGLTGGPITASGTLSVDITDLNYGILLYLANITDFTEGDLNVNNSDYLDSYSSGDFILSANEGDLNVNRSGYWDNLNSPSDINAADITDDGTYCTAANGNCNQTDTDTTYTAEESYIYLDSTTFKMNETVLNATIDDRDSDTTYTAGTGLSLAGTVFSSVNSGITSHCANITNAASNLCTITDTSLTVAGSSGSVQVNDGAGDLNGFANLVFDTTNGLYVDQAINATNNITTHTYFIGDGSKLTNLPASAGVDYSILSYTENITNMPDDLTNFTNTPGYVTGDSNVTTSCFGTAEVLLSNGTCVEVVDLPGDDLGDHTLTSDLETLGNNSIDGKTSGSILFDPDNDNTDEATIDQYGFFDAGTGSNENTVAYGTTANADAGMYFSNDDVLISADGDVMVSIYDTMGVIINADKVSGGDFAWYSDLTGPMFFCDASGSSGRGSCALGGESTPDAMLEIAYDTVSSPFMISSAVNNDGDWLTVSTGGLFGFGTKTPGEKISVVGNINVTDNITSDGGYFRGDGSLLTGISASVTDVWVNESGDTMSGDLDLGFNNLEGVGHLNLSNYLTLGEIGAPTAMSNKGRLWHNDTGYLYFMEEGGISYDLMDNAPSKCFNDDDVLLANRSCKTLPAASSGLTVAGSTNSVQLNNGAGDLDGYANFVFDIGTGLLVEKNTNISGNLTVGTYIIGDGSKLTSVTADPTAYDDIGNPTSNSEINMSLYTTSFASSVDGWGGISINNTDADLTSDTSLLSLYFADSGDTNQIWLAAYDWTSPTSRVEIRNQASGSGGSVAARRFEGISDTNTYMDFNVGDELLFYAGGIEMFSLIEAASDEVVVNDPQSDVDFRVESNTNANAFKIDADLEKIGFFGAPSTNDEDVTVHGGLNVTEGFMVGQNITLKGTNDAVIHNNGTHIRIG